ncbi:MAG: STAS domain-containing protein [Bdellovibrionaceae bacterium]|nr:STAS domain-containing protein [Pseudobdellovibrionaceae bacterium]
MKTRLRKARDIYFFDIEGNLDMNGVDELQSFCSNNRLTKKKIVFNLKSLFFIGSTGIDVFSQILDLMKQNNNLKICCASSEFQKVFTNEGFHSLLFSTEEEAILSFYDGQLQQERELSFIQNECQPISDEE